MKNSGIILMTASHIVDDFYQGAVPALLPFLVLERHYTFTEASGITLAATALSSVAQPAFGIITDKRRMGWLVAAGLTIAGIGVGLAGLANSYILTWLAIALSGLGIAAYHPEAARTARLVAAGSQARMGWFAVGGNIGFALGPVLVTPTLLLTGVSGTPILTIPALVMGTVLLIAQPKLLSQSQAGAQQRKTQLRSLQDDWRSFFRLTGLVTCRSIMFYGFSSFLALYITKGLGLSKEIGEAGLTVFLASGAVGTLLGGWLADRLGRLQTVRLGYIGVIPALLGLVTFGQPWIFGFIALTALCVYIPFSNQVTLGQDYLPNRIGTASGVTLGLAVSVGGLCAPLLGALADATSVQLSLTLLAILPVVALALSLKLRDPQLQARPNLSNPPVEEVLQGNPQAGV